MAKEKHCPECGDKLPPNAPHGVCPRCLMRAGLEKEAGTTLESPSVIEGPGTRIGQYEVLELIGEGGMGLVYLAEQKKPVRRRVALKIIKPGMDSKQVIARFEAERQALALLDHPNIARVIDAGTTEAGRLYFAMEYVRGVSITKHCDEQKLSIEKRLKLFRQVCEGVEHAHQKGIIHRDLKPSNILVSIQGDKAVPKIIDFGIAKAVTQPLTEKTLYTHQGQVLGTPEYMSPEQVNIGNQDIDTRSDVYSLGVLLYVLLAGAMPFDRESLKDGGFVEIQRVIREEEPPSPSTRLTSLGEEAKEVAESRRTQVVTLARCLHKELEWIPLKAMRKDRTRRYRSASELADDIHNYLSGAPLIAGPETSMYLVRKFVRRHAGSVATAMLVAAVIVLALIVSTTMYFRAEKMRVLAEERAEEYRRSLYSNRIALANVAYRDRNIRRLRESLDACPEDLRAWEWQRLDYVSDQAVMTLRGHEDKVRSVAFSPDGRRILSAGRDKKIKLWDAESGTGLMTLTGHNGGVRAAFSPDGERIVSGSTDNTIKVWDAITGAEVMTLRGHKAIVGCVAFTLDGKRILSGSWDKTIKVWNAVTGAELITLRGHTEKINSVAFSPDGTRFISSSYDKTIRVWDGDTGNQIMVLKGHEGVVGPISISPDGKRIVSGSEDKTSKVWDMATGSELMTLRGHDRGVLSTAFSPDGSQIVTAGQTINVWDAASGTQLTSFVGHQDMISDVAFSPDGKRIVSGSWDKGIKVWEPGVDHKAPLTLKGRHKGMAFSLDDKHIVTGGKDETIRVWDAVTHNEVMKIDGAGGSVSFSPDGKRIISADGNDIKVFDALTGKKLMTLSGHEDSIWSMSYSPNGARIASGSRDKTIRIWDAAAGTEVMTLRGHGDWPEEPSFSPVSSVAFSPDGERIVSGSYDYTVKIWNARTGAEVMTLRGHPVIANHLSNSKIVNDVAFSPSGRQVGSASSDGTIRVWDVVTGSELLTLQGHHRGVLSVAFSPDGKRIVSGSEDETVKIWDTATGLEVTTLRIGGKVWGVSFSPDGKTMATASEISRGTGCTVTLWKSAAPAGEHGSR